MYLLRGKAKAGGMTFPSAFTAQATFDARLIHIPDIIPIKGVLLNHMFKLIK